MPNATLSGKTRSAQPAAAQIQEDVEQDRRTETETTPATEPPAARPARHPRTSNRPYDQLVSVTPRTMSDSEKNKVIEQLRAENNGLKAQVEEAKKVAASAFDKAKYMEKRANDLLQHQSIQNTFVLRAVRTCYESVAIALTPQISNPQQSAATEKQDRKSVV